MPANSLIASLHCCIASNILIVSKRSMRLLLSLELSLILIAFFHSLFFPFLFKRLAHCPTVSFGLKINIACIRWCCLFGFIGCPLAILDFQIYFRLFLLLLYDKNLVLGLHILALQSIQHKIQANLLVKQ